MNVWAINKDIPLKLLLLELVHRYGENTLALNNQEQHFQAIDLSTRLTNRIFPPTSTPLVKAQGVTA